MSPIPISCPPGNCLGPGSIELLADGFVEEPALSMFLDHIESCPHCQGLLDSKIAQSGKNFFPFSSSGIPKSLSPWPEGRYLTGELSQTSIAEIQFSRLLESLFRQQLQNPKKFLSQSQFSAFECFDSVLGESVLAWCLHPEWATLAELTQSLELRAHLVRQASHPSLPKIRRLLPSPLGPVVITTVPEGQNLSQASTYSPFSSLETAGIALQLLGGIEVLHKKGIVLGPISLGDIFVQTHNSQSSGQIKACWGNVVFRQGLGLPGSTITPQAFQSPEQSLGKFPDYRSDFFCLGSVIFFLLTGQKPWPDFPEQTQHPKPLQSSQLTTQWRSLLGQLWELSPDDRLVDHPTLAKLLTKIIQGEVS